MLLTILLNWIVKKIVTNRIKKSSTAVESVRKRKLFIFFRVSILLGYTVLIVGVIIVFADSIFPPLSRFSSLTSGWFIFASVLALCAMPYASMSLPISGLTIDKLKDKDFALFLRGFSSDDYNPSAVNKVSSFSHFLKGKVDKKPDVMKLPFSERSLCGAIKLFMPVYSVGMTKELESPEGSKRIYLDDATWQKDVASLINKAKYVFVLVHDSDSCLWEIQQCQETAMNKTLFFIDDSASLKQMLKKEQKNVPDCLRVNNVEKHSAICMINGERKVFSYKNDEAGFEKVLRSFFEERAMLMNENNIFGMYGAGYFTMPLIEDDETCHHIGDQ